MAEVRLVDLELIKRYSLAVRRDTVDAEELLGALDASRATVLAAMGRPPDVAEAPIPTTAPRASARRAPEADKTRAAPKADNTRAAPKADNTTAAPKAHNTSAGRKAGTPVRGGKADNAADGKVGPTARATAGTRAATGRPRRSSGG